ncbi:MAG: hypothetical protein KKB21_02140 [Nanoarchaeota archaeon]|nr:hypothetical protein [Nanoarchaeota archaeon]MBU4086355.1 hypothetical protein [Nanoarchaeota archaeon]
MEPIKKLKPASLVARIALSICTAGLSAFGGYKLAECGEAKMRNELSQRGYISKLVCDNENYLSAGFFGLIGGVFCSILLLSPDRKKRSYFGNTFSRHPRYHGDMRDNLDDY